MLVLTCLCKVRGSMVRNVNVQGDVGVDERKLHRSHFDLSVRNKIKHRSKKETAHA